MTDVWCMYCTIWGLVWKIASERSAVAEELTWHMTVHCDTGTNTPHLRFHSVVIHHHFLPVSGTCTPPLPVLRHTPSDLGIRAQKAFRSVTTYKTQARIHETRKKTKHAHYSIEFNLLTRASTIIIKVKMAAASSLILNLYEGGGRLYSPAALIHRMNPGTIQQKISRAPQPVSASCKEINL